MTAAASQPVGPLAALALLAIRGYQRWLSPLKGFRCAHAVLHGGPGCSGYVASAIRARGLWGAAGAIRQRFQECRAAYAVLHSTESGGQGHEEIGRKVNKSLIVKKDSDSPCADAPCSGAPNTRSCIGEGAGHVGCGACSACDLGAISCCG